MFITVLIFFGLIAVLVLAHEAGHFFVAKAFGVRVEEFGFGFPPRLFGFQWLPKGPWRRLFYVGRSLENAKPLGGTVYSVNLLPLGGFVRLVGEDTLLPEDPQSFSGKSVGVRAAVIVAGVVMNMILAAFLFAGGHASGLPTVIEDDADLARYERVQVQIIEVAPNSPAASAGLSVGDALLAVNGTPVNIVDAVQEAVRAAEGHDIAFTVRRGAGEELTLHAAPRINPPEGEGPLGIAMVRTGVERLGVFAALREGIRDTADITVLFIDALGGMFVKLFTTGSAGEEIAGPVGIAIMTGKVAKLGLAHILQFAGAISVNLAIINIFPIPALDGGRLLFLVLERLRGKPVSRRAEAYMHQVGFMLLLLLMVLITVHDVIKLF